MTRGTIKLSKPVYRIELDFDEHSLEANGFVRVTRCKDCHWYGIDKLKADGTEDMRYSPSLCIYWRTHTNKDDYCSNGRKEE